MASQAETDSMVMDELGKLQTILAAQGMAGIATLNELGKLQEILVAQGMVDSQYIKLISRARFSLGHGIRSGGGR